MTNEEILEILDEDIVESFCPGCREAGLSDCPAGFMPSDPKCIKSGLYKELESHTDGIHGVLERAKEVA
ncbi:MAG TPA: hypothetical protein PKI32_01365 [Opitutales bacterium]|nr:hypothetical protein [Opitutales bacterium]